MPNYEVLYKDIFEDPKNYSLRPYHAKGYFNKCPIFIGGTGRSGTTIIARTLSQHPSTLNFVEVRFLLSLKNNRDLKEKLPPFYEHEKTYEKVTRGLRVAGYRDAHEVYSREVLENICLNDAATATKRFFEIGLQAWKKSVTIEKTPHTFLVADVLYKIFPNLRYIHVFRDPRDIFASVKPLGWGPNNAEKFVEWYNNLVSAAYKIKKDVPRENYLLVKLEDLVKHTRKELPRIFKYVNLRYKNYYSSLITRDSAHLGRYIEDLTNEEIDIVWDGCKKEYLRLNRLYRKERNVQ
jgi:hypothetical protein